MKTLIAGVLLALLSLATAAHAGTLDDIKKAAVPVLRHRISTNFQAQAEGKSSEDIIRMLLEVIRPRDEAKYNRKAK